MWPFKKRNPRYTVFHVSTGDGNTHEVAARGWIDWLAMRSLERQALPSQEDLRFMLRHMDDLATDVLISELLAAAIPRVRRAALRGGIDLQ